jgi:CMP-2-keto-3-deoxyoctulosonic acid synthetase
MAARWNSSRAPESPLRRIRSKPWWMHLNEPHAGKGFANRRAVCVDQATLSRFAVPAPSVLWLVECLDPNI